MLFGLEIAQTRNFLADDSVRTRGVRWGLSLDMTGEDTKKTGGTFLIEKMPDPVGDLDARRRSPLGVGRPPAHEGAISFRTTTTTICSRAVSTRRRRPGWVVRTNPFEGGSDHTPFLQFKKPGALFWHFTDVFYHTDGDRLDKVSKPELVNVGIAALVVGADADVGRRRRRRARWSASWSARRSRASTPSSR